MHGCKDRYKKYTAHNSITKIKGVAVLVFEVKALKSVLRVFLRGFTVAMVTPYNTNEDGVYPLMSLL